MFPDSTCYTRSFLLIVLQLAGRAESLPVLQQKDESVDGQSKQPVLQKAKQPVGDNHVCLDIAGCGWLYLRAGSKQDDVGAIAIPGRTSAT